MNIYCISGLGADNRMFSNLNILGANLIHIEWPKHDVGDTMGSYAQKVSACIYEDNPIIIGLSFGGMIAVEISNFRKVRKVIIISSIKTIAEKPKLLAALSKVVRINVCPAFLFKSTNLLVYYLFGTESVIDRKLLKNIMKDSNGTLVKWSVNAIMQWKNNHVSGNVIHIHGKKDRLLSVENINADYWVEDGGHMMIFNRADIVSKFVQQEIEKL